MELRNDGLTLWYDTADAPVTPQSVTVGVRPAHPANVVLVHYRTDRGFISTLRTSPIGSSCGQEKQYFQAALPEASMASGREILPVLMCSGRQAPSPMQTGETSPFWFRAPNRPSLSPARSATNPDTTKSRARFPYELEFLGAVTVSLAKPPESVGLTPQGLRINFYFLSGSCVGDKLNARIRPAGGDWMLIQRDGVGLPGVRTTWETPEGALLYGEYSGVFDLGETGYESAAQERFPERATVQLTPRFVTADARYAWINRLQCLGLGEVDLVTFTVAFDLYAIRAALSNTRRRDETR